MMNWQQMLPSVGSSCTIWKTLQLNSMVTHRLFDSGLRTFSGRLSELERQEAVCISAKICVSGQLCPQSILLYLWKNAALYCPESALPPNRGFQPTRALRGALGCARHFENQN